MRLLTLLNSVPPDTTLFHIAMVMITDYNMIAKLSIADMAARCNVSKSTLSKFTRELGFDDYHDFKDSAVPAEKRTVFQLSYVQNIMSVLEQNNYDSYFSAIIQDISMLQKIVDTKAIDRFAKALVQYKKVASFGLMFSESAAIDLQYKLAYSSKFIYTSQDDRKQDAYIRSADADTLIIVFSNSGNFLHQQLLMPGHPERNIFAHTKAKIFAITANPAIKDLSFIEDAIVFPHETSLQTHAFLYQIIMDVIVTRYRYYTGQ